MRLPLTSTRLLAVIAAAVVIAAEAYVVLIDSDGTFSINGRRPYEVAEFADGVPVSQAFLMRGNGLQSVRVRLVSDQPASTVLHWTLSSGFADQPGGMTQSFEGDLPIHLKRGAQWVTMSFPRNGSSNDRWFTIDLRSSAATSAESGAGNKPRVTVMASRDNPQRGGVLWVGGVRQPGSLVMTAAWQGRTPYRRFVMEAAPNLPAAFSNELVQWVVVIIFHWACFVFVAATLRESDTAREHV
jgi:hypothetical protein